MKHIKRVSQAKPQLAASIDEIFNILDYLDSFGWLLYNYANLIGNFSYLKIGFLPWR